MANQPEEWENLEDQLLPGQTEVERFIEDHRGLLERRTKLVAVLGNYRQSQARLDTITAELRRLGYMPALVKEFADFEDKATPEKAGHIMDLARFCIMLDDVPGGQQVEYRMASERDITLVHLVDQNHGTTFMHGTKHLSNLNLHRIRTEGNLVESVRRGVSWAEGRVEERRRLVKEAEPWRT